MPLNVTIAINHQLITELHIGRLTDNAWDTRPDSINRYVVVRGAEPEYRDDWLAGTEFTHRYGDGAEECVRRALEALRADGD